MSTVWLEMVKKVCNKVCFNLTIELHFTKSWEDQRLRWNPEDFSNITEITLPVEKLWTPDIVLQNG